MTGKTDIYSLGVTFYHALVGKPPYDTVTGSEFTVQQKIVYEDLDLNLIPVNWKEVLSGCLLKKPEDRVFGLKTINFDDETVIDNVPKPISIKESEPVTIHGHQKENGYFILLRGLILFPEFIVGVLFTFNKNKIC